MHYSMLTGAEWLLAHLLRLTLAPQLLRVEYLVQEGRLLLQQFQISLRYLHHSVAVCLRNEVGQLAKIINNVTLPVECAHSAVAARADSPAAHRCDIYR